MVAIVAMAYLVGDKHPFSNWPIKLRALFEKVAWIKGPGGRFLLLVVRAALLHASTFFPIFFPPLNTSREKHSEIMPRKSKTKVEEDEVEQLSNKELKEKLSSMGINVGPIVGMISR